MSGDRRFRVEGASVAVNLLDDWRDITDDLDAGAPPTLALEDGVGAIQFSTALYKGGEPPAATPADIEQLFAEFCERNDLVIEASSWSGRITFGTGGVSANDAELIGAWQVSDGQNIALVTYTCLQPDDPAALHELRKAEAIAKSVEFLSAVERFNG